tara:strand:- start:210 stop:683 length:474 start_codon:yes stop_codon:yes gene_type:complete
MGQYFGWVCEDTMEIVYSNILGAGQKWMEQFYDSGLNYKSIMILTTDTTSLGKGGGDLNLGNMNSTLLQFVTPMLGLWKDKKIRLLGDYSDVKHDNYKDISTNIKLSVLSIIYNDFLTTSCNTKDLKNIMITYLSNKVPRINWKNDIELLKILDCVS